MRIVIAPDSFKDALRARGVAERIAAGLRSVLPGVSVDSLPVSDGGEGFAGVFGEHPGVHFQSSTTTDPLGRPIEAQWGTLSGKPPVSFYELASASGLEHLARCERNPMRTTTFGTGTLIRDTRDIGERDIVLGIGGSATTDAGCGIAQALGMTFFDCEDRLMKQPITGADLLQIAWLKKPVDAEASGVLMRIACDVTNPLTGPNGAAYVYGPQKGATPGQIEQLDAGLRHMAQLWRDQLGVDVEHLPGAGAAGGVGGGLVAMLGAELVPGAELVLDIIGFDERMKDTDLVITGEGRLDGQSLQGKAAIAVARRCQKAGVPCVALVGSVGEGAEQALDHGLSAYQIIGEGLPAEESIRRTGELLELAAMKLARERLLD
ncbi:MAG: glycerate kinase [Planctomycetota bacterium]